MKNKKAVHTRLGSVMAFAGVDICVEHSNYERKLQMFTSSVTYGAGCIATHGKSQY